MHLFSVHCCLKPELGLPCSQAASSYPDSYLADHRPGGALVRTWTITALLLPSLTPSNTIIKLMNHVHPQAYFLLASGHFLMICDQFGCLNYFTYRISPFHFVILCVFILIQIFCVARFRDDSTHLIVISQYTYKTSLFYYSEQ